jgi:hypothetical protein
MPTTPRHTLRYPSLDDTIDPQRDVENLAVDVDKFPKHLYGTSATVPLAQMEDGDLYFQYEATPAGTTVGP